MKRLQLRFESIQEVVGSDRLAVIMLTDEPRKRAISIICDEVMTHQILMRLQARETCKNMLPETLVSILPGEYEMMIYGVHDGQYQVVLADKDFDHSKLIRISDAVLLNIISGYPIYIEESLMNQQSIAFDEHARGVAIPINTMDTKRLNVALKQAISSENYELASQLRDEIKRRGISGK
ncbi:MAG: bifunctional nuclease family protein [Prevotella sp.]|jgi:hypothetical protein|nr:bifunctional nuclease family protein [Prevotella sp.]